MVYRRYRRSRSRTYRRYRRSSFGRARRSSTLQFAGMSSQRDLARFCLKYRIARQLVIPVGQGAGTGNLTAVGVLSTVPQYNAIAQLFDEVKINAVRVKVVPLWQTSVNDNERVMAAYAWDRSGIPDDGTTPTYNDICTYGSSYKTACTSFTKNQYTSTIVATDIQERSLYCPTLKLRETNNVESVFAKAFNPAFLYGIQLVNNVTGTPGIYQYEFEFAFDLTFRGTRYENTNFQ